MHVRVCAGVTIYKRSKWAVDIPGWPKPTCTEEGEVGTCMSVHARPWAYL